MIKAIQNYLDRFIPATIFAKGDPITEIRARILVGLYVSNIVATVVFALVFLVAMLISDSNPVQALVGTAIALVALLFQIFVFHKAANVSISGMLFSMIFFIFTFITTILSGGWTSPTLIIFFITPAVSFLVGGRQEGFYTSALVLMAVIAFKMADHMGINVVQIVPEEHIEIARISIWLIALILLTSCLTVYDTMLEEYVRK